MPGMPGVFPKLSISPGQFAFSMSARPTSQGWRESPKVEAILPIKGSMAGVQRQSADRPGLPSIIFRREELGLPNF